MVINVSHWLELISSRMTVNKYSEFGHYNDLVAIHLFESSSVMWNISMKLVIKGGSLLSGLAA